MKKNYEELLSEIRHSIIVSCQALPGEPLYCEERSLMPFMAKAAQMAGCRCIRTSSVRDVEAVKEYTGLPVIGLIKRNYDGYASYITPTMREIDELVAAEADIIALDCTLRQRGDGLTATEFLKRVRDKYPDIRLMADISTLEEGVMASENGADLVSTTMSGYTPYSPQSDTPDVLLAASLTKAVRIPVIAEGKIHTPQQAVQMFSTGVHAIVIGGAITRPLEIARRFFDAVSASQPSV